MRQMTDILKRVDDVEWLARKLCSLNGEYHDPELLIIVRPLPTIETPQGKLQVLHVNDYTVAPLWTCYAEQARHLINAGLIHFDA